jgi:hypothetical protein
MSASAGLRLGSNVAQLAAAFEVPRFAVMGYSGVARTRSRVERCWPFA